MYVSEIGFRMMRQLLLLETYKKHLLFSPHIDWVDVYRGVIDPSILKSKGLEETLKFKQYISLNYL